MMKSYELHLDLYWEIEAEDEDDAKDRLAEQIMDNNETVENIFFDSMEVREIKDTDMAPSIVPINNIPKN